jgi:hypothetical protein
MKPKPEQNHLSKRAIVIMGDNEAIAAGKKILATYPGVFKKLAEHEHAERKCANCVHFTDKIDKKMLKRLPTSQRADCKFVCLANDMATQPHLLRCGGDDFQNKYTI